MLEGIPREGGRDTLERVIEAKPVSQPLMVFSQRPPCVPTGTCGPRLPDTLPGSMYTLILRMHSVPAAWMPPPATLNSLKKLEWACRKC